MISNTASTATTTASAAATVMAAATTSSTSVKVAVRVRPMAAKELLANSKDCVEIIPGTQQIIVGGGPSSAVGTETIYNFTQKSFTFDYLFEENSSQEDLYNLATAPLVDRFLEGFNATILAYGQTGSGKTYSMGIGLDGIAAPFDLNNKGIVPRAITTIFSRIAALRLENDTFKASVAVSFMELYNEELVDLLSPRTARPSSAGNGPTIREDGTGKIFWVNLSEENVESTSQLLGVLQRGTLCRTTGSTDMNASSSRSHAIFTVTLRQSFTIPGQDGAPGQKNSLVSKFHFVDLAGSERLKRTNAEGDRKKEGISINQGLLALGNVISALGDESRKTSHVPYRDSKLTRMLQDSLGGNSQTLMLACISPSDLNYGETVNTLLYANRARNIKNRVAINQDWGGASHNGEAQREIKSLRLTISQLRTEIAMIRAGGIEINEAEKDSMAPIANFVGQTKLHFHQRRERDNLADIERLKSENSNQLFLLDRFQFLANRLAKQVRQLTLDGCKMAIERDSAIAEKCKLLGSSLPVRDVASISVPSSNDNIVDIDTSLDTSRAGNGDIFASNNSIAKMVKNYVNLIAQLRLQLSDCEDKLAWQYEAMSKLGQKRTKNNFAWSIQSLKDLNISTSPSQKRLSEVKVKEENGKIEASGERNLLEAIRENIELNEATKKNDFSLLSRPGLQSTAIHSSLLNNERDSNIIEDEDDDEHDDDSENVVALAEDQAPDIYLLINKLQNDIVQHEALAENIKKREAEYTRMQKAYESKLTVLQTQMAQFQKERDLALNKMTNGSRQQKVDAKAKFEATQRRLDSEISDTRRKLGENSRLQSNSKSRAEKLTSELQATIAALKSEKTRMMQELRTQTQKHRDTTNANMREISKLRRKEKTTSDIAKRLERSNQLQRLMLKKRNQEVMQTQIKLKQIMQSLKRASTPNKVMKLHSSGYSSPAPRPRSGKSRINALSGPAMNEILASVNSPVRVSVSQSLTSTRPEVDIRAQFKKQMVDKELASTVVCRNTQKTLQKLQKVRNRLIEEQQELIAERKRVVEANFKETGLLDEKSPQYMDERVQSIDVEVASIDNSMVELEASLQSMGGSLDSSYIGDPLSSAVDLNWDNALNILRSLDRIELEATLALFLEDLVSLRTLQSEYVQELEEKDLATSNLKQHLHDLQENLYAQMKKHREVNFSEDVEVVGYAEKTIGETLDSDAIDINDLETTERANPLVMTLAPISQPASSSFPDIYQLPVRISSPSRKNGMRPIALSPTPMPKLGDDFSSYISLKKDRPLSPIPLSRPDSSSFKISDEDPSLNQIPDEAAKLRRRHDLHSIGGGSGISSGDVFQRLANAHTQASQAKVIQRSMQIDKDALMQEIAHPGMGTSAADGSKRKSLTDMENSWNAVPP